MLELRGVTKHFGKEVRAVQDVSLSLGHGVAGLIGHNGAGKSTLMQMIAALTRPTSGQILFDGIDIARSRRRSGTGWATCRRIPASTRT